MAAILDCEKYSRLPIGATNLNLLGKTHRTYFNNKSLLESQFQDQYFGNSAILVLSILVKEESLYLWRLLYGAKIYASLLILLCKV